MNLLRPAQSSMRPLLQWAQRGANAMTIAPNNYYCCTTKLRQTTSWAGSQDRRPATSKPVTFDLHRKFLHSKNSNITIEPPKPVSISVINQLVNNCGPYARLMRMDRPIGMSTENLYQHDSLIDNIFAL